MTAAAPKLEPVLLTVHQVCDLTQLGRDVVYHLINTGDLPALQIGKQFRVPRAELDAWIERKTGTASKARPCPIQFTPIARKGRGKAAASQGRR